MKRILKLKTNLKCSGCVAKVTKPLDNAKEIIAWDVDLNSPDRILTVEMEIEDADFVIKILKDLGYKAEKLK